MTQPDTPPGQPLLSVRDLVTRGRHRGRPADGRRPAVLRCRGRRDAMHRRRIGLGQIHDGALDHAPAARTHRPHRFGIDPPFWSRTHQPGRKRYATGPRRRDRDDLPGTDDLAESGAVHRPPAHRSDPRPSGCDQGGSPEGRDRSDDGRAHRRAGAAPQTISARAFRWHAPAGDDRHRARLQSESADRRRADDGARRDSTGADPRAHAHAAARLRHRAHPHHPRYGRGRRDGRSRCRHAGRTAGGDRAGQARSSPHPASHTRRRSLPPCLASAP